MQTLKNNTGGLHLSSIPSVRSWKGQPVQEIRFVLSQDQAAELKPGDRIGTGLEMCETGLKSGTIIDVYYAIETIETRQRRIDNECLIDVVAMAKRIES